MSDPPKPTVTTPQTRRARRFGPDVFKPISKDHAAAIGYVAAHWSAVELSITFLAERLSGMSKYAAGAVLLNTPHLGQLNIIEVWLNLLGNDLYLAEWKFIRVEIDRIRPLRNQIVHCEWNVSGDDHYIHYAKAKTFYTLRFEPVTAEEMNKLADECTLLCDRLGIFSYNLMVANASKAINVPNPPGLARNLIPRPTTPFQPPKQRTPRLSSAQKRKAREAAGSAFSEKVEEA